MSDKNKIPSFQPGPAASAIISLSQALLAPLDALFKAQLHAARSFQNLVLQLGFPHLEVDENGKIKEDARNNKKYLYQQEFHYEKKVNNENPETFCISIPSLSLVPVAPLAVDNADFSFEFNVTHVDKHQQIQESEKNTIKKEDQKYNETQRPWYLVKEPVSLRGNLGTENKEGVNDLTSQSYSSIKINVKVSRQPMPAGLDKLLTTLNQLSELNKINPNQ